MANAFTMITGFNGAFSAGIASQSDTLAGDGLRVHLEGEAMVCSDNAFMFAARRLVFPTDWTDEDKAFTVNALALCFKYAFIGPRSDTRPNSTAQEYADTVTWLNDHAGELYLEQDLKRVMQMLLATKVNLYLTNHHTGTARQMTGYAAKVASAVHYQVTVTSSEAVWAAGHWLDSLFAWELMGVTGVEPAYGAHVGGIANAERFILNVSEDMRMRINASPAGTAKTTTCLAILERAARSPLVVTIPNVPSYDAARALREMIRANSLHYHTGRFALTGQQQLNGDIFTEEERQDIAAWIHAASPSSTLARARVLHSRGEVVTNAVYTRTMAVKKELLLGCNVETAVEVAKKMGIGTSFFAVQAGIVTEQDVLEARVATGDLALGPQRGGAGAVAAAGANARGGGARPAPANSGNNSEADEVENEFQGDEY